MYISIMHFQIQWGACYLTLSGNIIMYLTLVGLFATFDQDGVGYNTCWNGVLHRTYLLILHGNIFVYNVLLLIHFLYFVTYNLNTFRFLRDKKEEYKSYIALTDSYVLILSHCNIYSILLTWYIHIYIYIILYIVYIY